MNIDSTMLEVVNVHWLIWIILIYKCKLYQPMNEQKHWKRAVIIFMPTSIFVMIGHSPILIVRFMFMGIIVDLVEAIVNG